MATPPTATAESAPTADARTLVGRYFRIWNEGDPSAVDQLIAADWIDHAHPERRSPKDVRLAIAEAQAREPRSRVLVDAILGDGNFVTINGRIQTDGSTENRVWIVRVNDGLLREIWSYSAD